MKYQIYLNRDTSEFIEFVAKNENKKSATIIKELVEGLFKGIVSAVNDEQRKEVSEAVKERFTQKKGSATTL